MRYPAITLDKIDQDIISYYEYPENKDKGAFIEIVKDELEIRIKIDRFSTIMFYFTVHQNNLYGATKFDLLLKSLPATFIRKINTIAIIEFVRTNTLIGDKTFLDNIFALRPGCELIFNRKNGQYSINQWYKLPGDINPK